MKSGDRIRLQHYMMDTPTHVTDYVVEEFRFCLGIFLSENDRVAGCFTPLCMLFESGPESEQKYLPNYGEYYTNKVQGWMDI
jgi:hypothetical protein